MLGAGVHIGMSPPKADPLGDCTVQLFKMASQVAAGSDAELQSHGALLEGCPNGSKPKSGDTDVDATQDSRVDASIICCSGRER